jgi:hypothetical protein
MNYNALALVVGKKTSYFPYYLFNIFFFVVICSIKKQIYYYAIIFYRQDLWEVVVV